MDRRKALKNMGVALGYTVATPTLLNIMQSCKREPSFDWVPDFFSLEEGRAITQLVDILIPETDTPSASDVQVHLFIDRFAAEVMASEQQSFWKMVTKVFMDTAYESADKEIPDDLTNAELEVVLAKALKYTPEEKEAYDTLIENYMVNLQDDKVGSLGNDAARYAFATNLRGITILGYKTSEYIGERVLPYLPVPGTYVACGDVNELSEGKIWSPNR
ncbi:MAG: gluconate 2-dehydrogenase subunit 3 family protein [Flavobacteriaceae bacterium]|nr:gluconate 2-dehydrogenase subunit 3 family protein [Flavobacteriaceae bacterium]MDH3796858.1 gluconate 2-dehydrogenase subunit 3 family protein [Flavobacteriaceae bacterium]